MNTKIFACSGTKSAGWLRHWFRTQAIVRRLDKTNVQATNTFRLITFRVFLNRRQSIVFTQQYFLSCINCKYHKCHSFTLWLLLRFKQQVPPSSNAPDSGNNIGKQVKNVSETFAEELEKVGRRSTNSLLMQEGTLVCKASVLRRSLKRLRECAQPCTKFFPQCCRWTATTKKDTNVMLVVWINYVQTIS